MNTAGFAKEYATRGWSVFPLKARDKVPVVKWADVATSEVNMAVGWFDTDPDANIAIATGKRSGIVVIDIDAEHGGYDSLMALQDEYGPLPQTLVAKTGGGGEHLFFAYPAGVEIRNSASKLAHGIDVRGEGGYVVAAPSIHPNGQAYEWTTDIDQPLAPLPEWVTRKLSTNPEPIPVHTNGKIANGSRNQTLASLAGSMRKRGMETETIELALQDHNRKHCLPPLPEAEVKAIAQSIGRYEPKRIEITPASSNAIEELESFVQMRVGNPSDVWGLPYAWPRLSKYTGGKQLGELAYLGGEPGARKSYWAHQDAMMTAVEHNIPSLIWSGEMGRRQVYMRLFGILGVSKAAMKTGRMTSVDWGMFSDAKALLMNSPLYVSDSPLSLDILEDFVEREVGEHGIQHIVFDYDWLISARGDSEIETSQNISRACKNIARKLNVSIMLLSSVNKSGMDTDDSKKTHLSGSGKKIHDADNVFTISKRKTGDVLFFRGLPIAVEDEWRVRVLRIEKGREIDDAMEGGFLTFYSPPGESKMYELEKRERTR